MLHHWSLITNIHNREDNTNINMLGNEGFLLLDFKCLPAMACPHTHAHTHINALVKPPLARSEQWELSHDHCLEPAFVRERERGVLLRSSVLGPTSDGCVCVCV